MILCVSLHHTALWQLVCRTWLTSSCVGIEATATGIPRAVNGCSSRFTDFTTTEAGLSNGNYVVLICPCFSAYLTKISIYCQTICKYCHVFVCSFHSLIMVIFGLVDDILENKGIISRPYHIRNMMANSHFLGTLVSVHPQIHLLSRFGCLVPSCNATTYA